MKKIRKFEKFYYDPSYDYAYNQIDQICKKHGITNYTLNDRTGKLDVDGDVDLQNEAYTKLPIQFGIVTGYFNCSYNQLTSLEGAPEEVGGYFDCRFNRLTSLEGAPIRVGYGFYASDNQIR